MPDRYAGFFGVSIRNGKREADNRSDIVPLQSLPMLAPIHRGIGNSWYNISAFT